MGLIIAWQLRDKHILLIGGGSVALSRFQSLVTGGARLITVIATDIDAELGKAIEDASNGSVSESANKVQIIVHKRAINELDLTDQVDYDLVLSAISDHDVSKWIGRTCRRLRIPVNVADVPEFCDFYFGSMINRGPLQIMVSTAGNSPRLARRIRTVLETAVDELDPEMAIANMGKLRSAIRDKTNDSHEPKIIKLRMKWISKISDRLSFQEMASLQDRDIEELVDSFPDTPPRLQKT